MSTQHAVIIGGSAGIGLATARRLLQSGFKVTITGRSSDKLDTAKKELQGDLSTIRMDAGEAERVREMFATIGSFDHLVLALGSTSGVGPFASIAIADVLSGFQEKFIPHFTCAQAALSTIRKDGSITFISAVTAHAAMPGTAGIGAANAAVAALAPILAAELRPLRVNGVSPGIIDTAWWDLLPEGQKAQIFSEYAAKSPVGRIGQPDDVAKAISFLICDTFMTGHTIICDGGLRLTG